MSVFLRGGSYTLGSNLEIGCLCLFAIVAGVLLLLIATLHDLKVPLDM